MSEPWKDGSRFDEADVDGLRDVMALVMAQHPEPTRAEYLEQLRATGVLSAIMVKIIEEIRQ